MGRGCEGDMLTYAPGEARGAYALLSCAPVAYVNGVSDCALHITCVQYYTSYPNRQRSHVYCFIYHAQLTSTWLGVNPECD